MTAFETSGPLTRLGEALDGPGVLVALGVVLAWAALVAAVRISAASHPIRPGPPSGELDPDAPPPAVVSLIVNDWKLTPDAAEATLVDLGARGHLEFRQPLADPRQTTVHLTPHRAGRLGPATLTPYEQRVLGRVERIARDGFAPLTALTLRGGQDAKGWWNSFRHEVLADARDRGLSRPRATPAMRTLVGLSALVPSLAVGIVASRRFGEEPGGGLIAVTVFTWFALGSATLLLHGERDTPAGRQAAARWLGVRSFLRGDAAFVTQPPAAVAVWDRYLAYGAALGVTRVVLAVIDLGEGDPTRVWSGYGGTWRRVRVTYRSFPALGFRVVDVLGLALSRLVRAGWIALVIFGVGTQLWYSDLPGLDGAGRSFRGFDPDVRLLTVPDLGLPDTVRVWFVPAIVVLSGVAALLVLGALTLVVRGFVDLGTQREITGEVLWVTGRDVEPTSEESVPAFHGFAVDEGTADRTTAWALPHEWVHRSSPGDEVRLTVRPWTRRVMAIEVLHERPAPDLAPAVLPAGAAAEPGGTDLLAALPTPGSTPEGDTVVWFGGVFARMAWRASTKNSAARVLPGVGDEARIADGWALARAGEDVVQLQLTGPARHLPDEVVAERLRAALSQGRVTGGG